MKFRFFLLLMVICINTAYADYGNISLGELLTKVNYGVAGTIVKIDNNYFWLKIDNVIFGKIDEDTIAILKFREWAHGHRHDDYRIGQQEVVFFNKSNNDIPEFDYKGYGGGCEFELPIERDSITYHRDYDEYVHYKRVGFYNAIKDYKEFIDPFLNNSQRLDSVSWLQFSKRSALHKQINDDNPLIRPWYNDDEDAFEEKNMGLIRSAEANHLYERYDNKLFVSLGGRDFADVYITANEATVIKAKDHFIVKPDTGSGYRIWIYVIAVNEKKDTVHLSSELWYVYSIPDPTVYITNSNSDTLEGWRIRGNHLELKYARGIYRTDANLKYQVLRFDVELTQKGIKKRVTSKNEWGNKDLELLLRSVQPGDVVKYTNIISKYPDGRIVPIKDKVVYVIAD